MNGRNKRVLRALAVCAALIAPAGAAFALTATVGTTVSFLSSISMTPSSMQFGNIIYSATPSAGDTVTLTTAGARSFAGTHFSPGTGGTITAGSVAITASDSQPLAVECSTTAVLAQSGGSGRITINTIKVADVTNAGGGGSTCTGVGSTALTFTYTSATDNALRLGGIVDGATQVSWGGGSYSTSNAGGTAITVNVFYQ